MRAESVINMIIPGTASMAGQVSQTTSKGLSDETKTYLNKWLEENTSDPYPSRREKNEMMSRFNIIDEKKLDGWFCRARI